MLFSLWIWSVCRPLLWNTNEAFNTLFVCLFVLDAHPKVAYQSSTIPLLLSLHIHALNARYNMKGKCYLRMLNLLRLFLLFKHTRVASLTSSDTSWFSSWEKLLHSLSYLDGGGCWRWCLPTPTRPLVCDRTKRWREVSEIHVECDAQCKREYSTPLSPRVTFVASL